MPVATEKHRCTISEEGDSHSEADITVSDDGRMWMTIGNLQFQINVCPNCGSPTKQKYEDILLGQHEPSPIPPQDDDMVHVNGQNRAVYGVTLYGLFPAVEAGGAGPVALFLKQEFAEIAQSRQSQRTILLPVRAARLSWRCP